MERAARAIGGALRLRRAVQGRAPDLNDANDLLWQACGAANGSGARRIAQPQHPRHRLHPLQRHRLQPGQGLRPGDGGASGPRPISPGRWPPCWTWARAAAPWTTPSRFARYLRRRHSDWILKGRYITMERNYATQMDAARRGIVTPELETVARKEHMSVEELLPLVAGRQGGHPRQPPAHLPGPRGRRLHAAHQDQRQPGRLPGLQGLRRGDAEGACLR